MEGTKERGRAAYPVFGENGKIRPVPAEVDHFAFFGLPRRLQLDAAALEAAYYELSRRLHPDFYTNAPAAERIRSLDASARLNEAYQTLKDPVRRMVYLVELESGKMEENQTHPPSELLEEILEAQEAAMELKCCDEPSAADALLARLNAAKECFEALRAGQRSALDKLAAEWDRAAGGPPPRGLIDKMREILSQRNYLENVLRAVNEALETKA